MSILILFLKRRKKAREQVVTHQQGENNIHSNPPSAGGHSSLGLSDAVCSAVLYEGSENNQCVPSAPPLESPNLTSKLDRNYENLVTDYPYFANNINQLPSIPQRWT
ncbi:hypothetical protein HNY73_019063 [Argiope bruennichi]|uniref:Uncharacterized protein n=2 Tax=Argiope bruennichi TaxID=94029 RepID=A0A8T0EGE8_ARGBR|nr:hypothetical protein HNY73_019063 [Argiope bruennichi]